MPEQICILAQATTLKHDAVTFRVTAFPPFDTSTRTDIRLCRLCLYDGTRLLRAQGYTHIIVSEHPEEILSWMKTMAT